MGDEGYFPTGTSILRRVHSEHNTDSFRLVARTERRRLEHGEPTPQAV